MEDDMLMNETNLNETAFDFDVYCSGFGREDENETLFWDDDDNQTDYFYNENNTEAAAICALLERLPSNDQSEDDGTMMIDVSVVLKLLGGLLILLISASYPMRLAGNGQTAYVKDSLTKSLAASPFTALIAFYFFGYAFAFGTSGKDYRRNFVGKSYHALNGLSDDLHTTFFVRMAYCLASSGIWTGTVVERGHMALFFYGSLWFAAWVYPVVAHTLWSENGLLSAYLTADDLYHDMGVIDVHGAGVVHMTGGVAAFIAGKILQPRKGRFHDPETGKKLDHPTHYATHSEGLQALGTFLFWVGSYGPLFLYDNADVAALAAVNITLAAGFGGFFSFFADAFLVSALTGVPEYHLMFALHGAETALVSISAAAAIVEAWAAATIGLIGGLIYVGSHRLVEEFKFFRVDDIVDAVPVHGYGGMWGLMSVAIFARGALLEQAGFVSDEFVGLVYAPLANLKFLLIQVAGLAFILGWVAINMAFVCFVLKLIGILREEVKGDEDEELKDRNDEGDTSSNNENNEDQALDPTEDEPPVDDDDEDESEDGDDDSGEYDTEDDLEFQEALKKRT